MRNVTLKENKKIDMKKIYIFLSVFALLKIFDILTTFNFLNTFGIENEGNFILRYFLGFGIFNGLVLHSLLVVFPLVFISSKLLYSISEKYFKIYAWIFIILGGIVPLWNIYWTI